MKIELPKEVEQILNSLENNGFEAYVVGGCIRDRLLGKEPLDWDICTSALPREILDCFLGLEVAKTGLKHGTVTIILNHKPYEITTYRVDGVYSNNRHPDKVSFVRELKKDLSRRDFTINALAYNSRMGLVDFHDGLADLNKKIIRSVGEANKRFLEDGLRLMRALRFASTYGFDIEKKTAEAIFNQKALLQNIAWERIQVELDKLLCGRGVKTVLKQFTPVLSVVIPEIEPMIGFKQRNPHHHLDVWEHTIESVSQVPPQKVLRLTMLLHDSGKPQSFTLDPDGIGHFYGHGKKSMVIAKEVLNRLRYDKKTIQNVNDLILYHDVKITPQRKYIKRWLNRMGEKAFRQLLEVKKADTEAQNPKYIRKKLEKVKELESILEEVIKEQQCFSLKDLAINGNDLIGIGITQGIKIGDVLDKLLEMVIGEKIENEKEELLKMAKVLSDAN